MEVQVVSQSKWEGVRCLQTVLANMQTEQKRRNPKEKCESNT